MKSKLSDISDVSCTEECGSGGVCEHVAAAPQICIHGSLNLRPPRFVEDGEP
jgi:hypothetical protein